MPLLEVFKCAVCRKGCTQWTYIITRRKCSLHTSTLLSPMHFLHFTCTPLSPYAHASPSFLFLLPFFPFPLPSPPFPSLPLPPPPLLAPLSLSFAPRAHSLAPRPLSFLVPSPSLFSILLFLVNVVHFILPPKIFCGMTCEFAMAGTTLHWV